jgi:hypothetical protein
VSGQYFRFKPLWLPSMCFWLIIHWSLFQLILCCLSYW